MSKYPIYFIVLFAITNILVAEEAMAQTKMKTCTGLSILRADEGQIIALPMPFPPYTRPIRLTKGVVI